MSAWAMAAASALQAGLGAWGANQAANAQKDAAKRAADANYRGSIAALQMAEPDRSRAYQAGAALDQLYGFQTAPYTPISQVQNTLTKLGAKEAKAVLKRGGTFSDLQSMGTLGDLNAKQYKRLSKYLNPNQIQMLRAGPASAPAAAPAPAPSAPATPGNMSGFFASPDYQFRLSEGNKAIDRSAAARSGAISGNTIRANTGYASNLAAGEFGNWRNFLLDMATGSRSGTNTAVNAVTGAANAQGNAAMQIGDSRASGILGVTNSIGQGINSGVNNYLLYQYMNRMPQPGQPRTQNHSVAGPWASGYVFPGRP